MNFIIGIWLVLSAMDSAYRCRHASHWRTFAAECIINTAAATYLFLS